MAKGTRERVLDETLRLVAERGLAGTNVIDIEAAAGLSPGSGAFYRHFPSKEDSLRAAVDRELDRIRARQHTRVDEAPSVGDPRELVASQVEAGLAWLDELGALIAIVAREGGRQPELARAVQDVIGSGGMTAGLENVTRAAAEAGRDPLATTLIVVNASVGYHLAEAFFGEQPGGLSPQRFAATLADMVCSPSAAKA
jgi:AcrR family transcriptional regulator